MREEAPKEPPRMSTKERRKIYDWEGLKQLKSRLAAFYNSYIRLMQIHRYSILNSLDGIQFLPIDSQSFLRVQRCVNLAENVFPTIESTMILYQHFLIWSGFEQNSTRTLYSHFAGGCSPELSRLYPPSQVAVAGGSCFLTREEILDMCGLSLGRESSSPSSSSSFAASGGGGLAGVGTAVGSGSDPGSRLSRMVSRSERASMMLESPRAEPQDLSKPHLYTVPVYLEERGQASGPPPRLAVFRYQSLSLIFLLRALQPLTLSRLQEFLNTHLPALSLDEWAERKLKEPSLEDAYRFVYFNSVNLALKTGLPFTYLGADILRMLNRMKRDFLQNPDITERVVQTRKHQWIVAKSSDRRFLFLVIDGPAESVFSLTQVDEHVQRLTTTVFGNIWW